MTGCQGELVEEEFTVLIEDENGEVVIDEVVTSQGNGFMDFWLPRDKKYTVTIELDGMSAVKEISTFEEDATCVTDIQLS